MDCERRLSFFFSSRRRHTRYWRDWSSDVCSSDLLDLRRALRALKSRLVQVKAVNRAAFVEQAPELHEEVVCVVRFSRRDRKSTRLNSSHANISYAVFCLKKKKQN